MKTSILLLLLTSLTAYAQVPIPNVPPKINNIHSLVWNSFPATSYVLRRGIVSGKYDEMVFISGALTNYNWVNFPIGVTNYYVISSRDFNADEGSYSNELKVEPKSRLTPPTLKLIP